MYPTFQEVLYHCIRSQNMIATFNYECDCTITYHQLPDLVNNHKELKGKDRFEIDMLTDYIINFIYLPIIRQTI